MAHKKGELLLVKLALELQLIRRADSKSNSPFLCACVSVNSQKILFHPHKPFLCNILKGLLKTHQGQYDTV